MYDIIKSERKKERTKNEKRTYQKHRIYYQHYLPWLDTHLNIAG